MTKELLAEIRNGLNVTDEELLRLRNGCEGREHDIKIWAILLQKIVDHVRRIRALQPELASEPTDHWRGTPSDD